MSANYQTIGNLKVEKKLLKFVNTELLEGTEINTENFWIEFDKAVHDLTPKNKELLTIRKELQKKIDDWHVNNKGSKININEYKKFLVKIGYLKKEGPDFKIQTKIGY